MIAIASANPSTRLRARRGRHAWSDRFLEMLPGIRRIARFCFRQLARDEREEAIGEAVANAYVAFCRLVERGKADIAYPTPLGRYAVAQVRAGRRVGASLNLYDVTSAYCQQKQEVVLETLSPWQEDGRWQEILVEDRHSTPADIATTRIDFRAWLRRLDRRRRAAARLLAGGASTSEAAKELGVSPARVSQLRSELRQSWQEFQSEPGQLVAA